MNAWWMNAIKMVVLRTLNLLNEQQFLLFLNSFKNFIFDQIDEVNRWLCVFPPAALSVATGPVGLIAPDAQLVIDLCTVHCSK